MIKLILLAVVVVVGLLYFNKIDAGKINTVVKDNVDKQIDKLQK